VDTLRDWLITIGMIIIKPLPQTFITESKKAKGKLLSSILWLVLAVIALNVHDFFVRGNFSVSVLLFMALLIPLDFLFFVFCINMLYMRLFNKKQDYYSELLYLIVAILIPFITILSFLVQIPVLGDILFWTTLIYSLILTVLAVKAVTKLEYWQSVTTVVLGSALAMAGFFCIPAFFLSITRAVPSVLK
jgi:hypothetical protein